MSVITGPVVQEPSPYRSQCRPLCGYAGILPPDAEDDTEDTDFVYVDSDEGPDPPALLTCSDSDDKEDNNDNNEDFFNISPEETADILPSKSLPDASVKVNARLRQATIKCKQTKESARNPDAAQPANKRTRPSADPDIKVSASTTATTATTAAIKLLNADGQVGNPGVAGDNVTENIRWGFYSDPPEVRLYMTQTRDKLREKKRTLQHSPR
ncbi:hypothetical protein HGRIS_001048 [Hohenbuehelia grisea]|uniref:Uncharacterized protein n=1 Tax=Hohenbuehelia grisea TaxID=104357 RepID=A0ABR3JNP5_9AGAR